MFTIYNIDSIKKSFNEVFVLFSESSLSLYNVESMRLSILSTSDLSSDSSRNLEVPSFTRAR
ncbi:MAG: hypothetical protein SPD90_12700, partial [Intestinibacter sp.]|uniref:hypothetical protein n=1 Tax=Intestinibacter sp. TaxID=1965304 RepID=UPI002A828B0A